MISAAAILAWPLAASAQTTAAPAASPSEDDPIELSPFTVTTDELDFRFAREHADQGHPAADPGHHRPVHQ
jgi:hypothetical protein